MTPPPDNTAAVEEAWLLAQTGAEATAAPSRILYGRYSAPLLSLGVRLVGNLSDAEEMLQDAFVKIWRNAASYDSRKSRPFTWAVTIMRRTCIDHLRRRRLHLVPTAPLPDEAAEVAAGGGDLTRLAAESREESERSARRDRRRAPKPAARPRAGPFLRHDPPRNRPAS